MELGEEVPTPIDLSDVNRTAPSLNIFKRVVGVDSVAAVVLNSIAAGMSFKAGVPSTTVLISAPTLAKSAPSSPPKLMVPRVSPSATMARSPTVAPFRFSQGQQRPNRAILTLRNRNSRRVAAITLHLNQVISRSRNSSRVCAS